MSLENVMQKVSNVIKQAHRISVTPPVDDDFPEVKHDFDAAVLDYASLLTPKNAAPVQVESLLIKSGHVVSTTTSESSERRLRELEGLLRETQNGSNKSYAATESWHRRVKAALVGDANAATEKQNAWDDLDSYGPSA